MIDYVAHLRTRSDLLADSARGLLGAPVPSCPDWSVVDLVWHTGVVHHFWNAVASGEAAGPRDVTEPPRPPDEEIIDWFLSGAERLANTLESQDDEVEVWTWWPEPAWADSGEVRSRQL